MFPPATNFDEEIITNPLSEVIADFVFINSDFVILRIPKFSTTAVIESPASETQKIYR